MPPSFESLEADKHVSVCLPSSLQNFRQSNHAAVSSKAEDVIENVALSFSCQCALRPKNDEHRQECFWDSVAAKSIKVSLK